MHACVWSLHAYIECVLTSLVDEVYGHRKTYVQYTVYGRKSEQCYAQPLKACVSFFFGKFFLG